MRLCIRWITKILIRYDNNSLQLNYGKSYRKGKLS